MLRIGLITLGCDKNTVDSERYLADLVAHLERDLFEQHSVVEKHFAFDVEDLASDPEIGDGGGGADPSPEAGGRPDPHGAAGLGP